MNTLRERMPGPLFAVDGGDSLAAPLPAAGNAREARSLAKARLIASAWVESGLDAAAIGAAEWSALGRENVLELVDAGYPATAANLVCEDGRRPLPAGRVIEKQGRRLGVVAVTEGTVPGCTVTEPLHAAVEALTLLESEELDATVLLWPDRDDRAHSAALRGLNADFVVDASGRYSKADHLQRAGRSWLIGAGSLTKAIGTLQLVPGEVPGYHRKEDLGPLKVQLLDYERRLQKASEALESRPTEVVRKQHARLEDEVGHLRAAVEGIENGNVGRLRFTLTTLDDTIPDDPDLAARVEQVKAGFALLPDATPAEILARPLEGPEGSAYAGAAACASCHAEATRQWRTTPHARAYTALLKDQHHLDDSCFGCHVTGGLGDTPAVATPEEAAGLIHVQCEACHGPARAHAQDPGVLPVRSPGEAVCTTCHDGERDEGSFDWTTYRPKVVHAP